MSYLPVGDRKAGGAAFGYTDAEILRLFGDKIDAHQGEYPTKEAFMDKLREYYGGYCFAPDFDDDILVYNPLSVNRFFENDCKFDVYWDFDTDEMKYVSKLAKPYSFEKLTEERWLKCGGSDFSIPTHEEYKSERWWSNFQAAIYMMSFTGILSFERDKSDFFHFGKIHIPNKEIEIVLRCVLSE